MKRTLIRIGMVVYQIFVFGFLIYIVVTPWIRDFSLDVYASLPNYPDLILLAVLITIADLGIIYLVIKRRPWPYAISARTLWRTWRTRRKTKRPWKETFLKVRDQKGLYEFNAPFAPLDIPYLRLLFIPLLYLSIPFLATIEEMIFRDGKDTLLTILLFSVLFALAHIPSGFRVMDLSASFAIGMICAFYYISDGLPAAIVLHTAINIFGVAVLVWNKVVWPKLKPHLKQRSLYINAEKYMNNQINA